MEQAKIFHYHWCILQFGVFSCGTYYSVETGADLNYSRQSAKSSEKKIFYGFARHFPRWSSKKLRPKLGQISQMRVCKRRDGLIRPASSCGCNNRLSLHSPQIARCKFDRVFMPMLSTEQAYSLQFYWLLRVLFYTTYTEKSVIITFFF